MWKVPLFDLNFDEEEEKAVLEVIKSKWISSGQKVKEFEKEFKTMVDANYAVAVSNCTAALHLAMITAGIKEGDEVIVPSMTFVATVNVVRYVGAIPVFADIVSEKDLTIDPNDVENKITDKTKAIIVMHYAGYPANMDKIIGIAKKYNLLVIEDAAHAPASFYNGKHLGTFGISGAFSFFANKNMTTAEGGMLVTDSDEVAEKAKLLRSHGMTTLSYDRYKGHASSYDVVALGYNYRMDEIRAAIGLVQLRKLKEGVEKRKKIVRLYNKLLSSYDFITIPFKDKVDMSSHYIYVVVLNKGNRDKVRSILKEKYGVQTSVHYPPVHKFSIYRRFPSYLPKTEDIANKIVTLPLFDSMSEDQVKYVVDSLIKAVRESIE